MLKYIYTPRVDFTLYWIGSAITAGGSLLGGLSGNRQARKEARRNREFQERMSKNAHQYEVADLRKAGLNPILSAGGSGSATPSGSAASQSNPAERISSAMALRTQNAQISQMNSQKNLNDTNAWYMKEIKPYTDIGGASAKLLSLLKKNPRGPTTSPSSAKSIYQKFKDMFK